MYHLNRHLTRRLAFLKSLSCLALLLLGTAVPAMATSFIMPTDSELLQKSSLVVVGRVVAADAAPGLQPSTDFTVEISHVAKGFLPGTTIMVRELGGLSADRTSRMMVLGSAPLSVGEEFLLFLEEHTSGTYRIMDLALGAFWHVPGENLALRFMVGSAEISLPNDTLAAERQRSHLPRRFDAFVDWLTHHASNQGTASREASYFVENPTELVGVSNGFNLTLSPSGNPPSGCPVNAGSPVRWQEFDNGLPVTILANEGGQPGVTGGGFTEVQQGIAAWKAVSSTNTNLVYGGTTPVTSAVSGTDFLNTISFEDPNNQIAGSFPSAPSGTLMITVVFFRCETVHAFLGGIAHTLIEAGIVSQDGAGSFFFNNTNFAEVIAHEIGHVFGISHACGDPTTGACSGLQDGALMRAFVHNDGRGAQLNDDDRAALRTLYATASAGGPAASTALTATPTSTSTIDLAWTDNANNETGYSLEQRTPPATDFSFLGNVAPDSTSATITGLTAETATEFRVRAFNANSFSAYSNIAGATTFAIPGPCVEDATTLCLLDERFKVTIDFATPQGSNGTGQAKEITPDTGYFWFFQEQNVEVVVKVIDACIPAFDRFWIFSGGLTNVQTTMTVVDTSTGATRTYSNSLNTPFQPVQDTDAFATCP